MIQIELKNIQRSAFASEETHCYTAKLFVDGKFFATVKNDGHGGGDYIVAYAPGESDATYREVTRRVAAEHPKLDMSEYGMAPIDTSLETVCAELVNDWLREQDLKRLMKRKVLLFKEQPVVKGAPLFEVGVSKGKVPADLIPAVRKNHPKGVILNELPFDEALKLYALAA